MLKFLVYVTGQDKYLICIGNSMICSDISKLLYVISRAIRRVKFATISIGNSMICGDIWHKYHE